MDGDLFPLVFSILWFGSVVFFGVLNFRIHFSFPSQISAVFLSRRAVYLLGFEDELCIVRIGPSQCVFSGV